MIQSLLRGRALVLLAVSAASAGHSLRAADLVPPAATIKPDRPRLLLRPGDSPYAVSLKQLAALPRDRDFQRMAEQLEGLKPPRAAALAMVYLLTGRPEVAQRAVDYMRAWQPPADPKPLEDPFYVYGVLSDMALAYDWLYAYPGFDAAAKTALRAKLAPLAQNGLLRGEDHVFHNYTWMFNSGAMLWALATAGDDPACDRLLAGLSRRFNRQLFPAMEYLEGGNGDAAGYWWRYCLGYAVQSLLATQSAFETDVVGAVRREHGDWLNREMDDLVLSVLPDMRFVPWGDIVIGANGGVTHEMAGRIDTLTWALRSPHGAYLSRWLAQKRGLDRFLDETAIFYFLYTRNLAVEPATPPLSTLAGGGLHGEHSKGGHVIMRSDWGPGATVVGFRCADFFGQHLHLDQGSFVIYRNGHLALDAGCYRHVGGPQARTDAHNTLLFGGQGQRPEKFQSARTLEMFTQRLARGLATGDILFYKDAGPWAAVAGQFAQAYDAETVQSCVRQLLFVRPGVTAVVDQVAAPEGRSLPEVRWLLQVPGRPEIDGQAVVVRNAKSYLRCVALAVRGRPQGALSVENSYPTPAGANSTKGNPAVIDASRVVYAYEGKPRLTLIHLLEIGDGPPPPAAPAPPVEFRQGAVELLLDKNTYRFSAASPFDVSPAAP
ncbi:MAG: heparinase II/III family protein [Thermoguttaceae bacterium]